VTYVTDAQIREAFARHLRPPLRKRLDEDARPTRRAVAGLTRDVEEFMTRPGYQLGIVEPADTARLLDAVFEYGREVTNIAAVLTLARAYEGVDLEAALAQIFAAALRQRRTLPALISWPRSIEAYGSRGMPSPTPKRCSAWSRGAPA
jgi:hypothetical protein